MRYPFLTDNELILIDYAPGSGGHLLLRIWSELDARLNYDNSKILTDHTLNDHKSTREVEFELPVPKRMTNWFLNKSKPETVEEFASFFEFLGTFLFASQSWKHDVDFYEDENYKIQNRKVLYGIHSWHKNIPFKQLQDMGCNVKCISIIANTEEGRKFQYERGKLCYPITDVFWKNILPIYNNKNNEGVIYFDFCTLLATKNTNIIIEWLRIQLGEEFRSNKVARVTEILDAFYSEIVDNL